MPLPHTFNIQDLRVLAIRLMLSIVLVFAAQVTWAARPYFGVEWTFTNQMMIDSGRTGEGYDDRVDARERWLEIIRRKCRDCQVEPSSGKVTLPSKLWFSIGFDPWVLEVNASPMTLEEIRENKELLQELVWDAAKEAGATPHWRVGGGHIHLDIEGHFGGDKLLLRNFVVDLMNNPELFMGGFGYDYLNAPPLAVLGKTSIFGFKQALQTFDRSREPTIGGWFNAIQDRAYRAAAPLAWQAGHTKYQAINFMHREDGTIELRGFRPQVSIEHMELLAEILTGRIQFLKRFKEPIPYVEKDYYRYVSASTEFGMEKYETNIKPTRILDVVTNYIKQTGVDPERYTPYITEELKTRMADRAERSLLNRCSRLFH